MKKLTELQEGNGTTHPIGNFKRIEEFAGGNILLDEQGKHWLLLNNALINPLDSEEEAFLRKASSENRELTSEENDLIRNVMLPVNSEYIKMNSDSIRESIAQIEQVFGVLQKKPSDVDLQDPLWWQYAPLAATLHSGVELPCVLITRNPSDDVDYLLSDVQELKLSPYAIPLATRKQAKDEAEEIGMGSRLYPTKTAESEEKYSIDPDRDYFFKHGEVQGSELVPVHAGKSNVFELPKLPHSEDIQMCIILAG